MTLVTHSQSTPVPATYLLKRVTDVHLNNDAVDGRSDILQRLRTHVAVERGLGATHSSMQHFCMSKSKGAEPLEQLELVHIELNRQRDATVDKHRTMYQRSSLLIGAATLVTGVQAARIPAAISAVQVSLSETSRWAIVHTASALTLAVLATILALAAAIHGIRAIMVETGGEIDIEKLAQNVLGPPADLYTAEWSLVRDKIGVHLGDMLRLESRRKLFTRGATFLVVSWVIAILQFATSAK